MLKKETVWLTISWIAALAIAGYCHYYLGIDAVYTHFFYFVLALTAVYRSRYLIPTAAFLSILHISLGYLTTGAVGGAPLARALMMLVVGFIIDVMMNYFYSQERVLKEKQDKLQLLVENISDVPWILNLTTGKWEYMSPAIEQLTGYTLEEILNQPVKQILVPEAYPVLMEKLTERIESYIQDGTRSPTYRDWIEHTRKDGSKVAVEFMSKYVKNDKGDLLLVGISRDISERHEMAMKLATNNEIMESLLKNTPNLMAIIDNKGKCLMVSETMADFLGASPEEVKEKYLKAVMPSLLASKYEELIAEISDKKEPVVKVETIPSPDGERIFEIWGFPLIKFEGQVELICSIGMEITDRWKDQEKIRQQNLEIIALTNNVSDIIARFDKNFRYVYTNQKKKTARFLGKTNRELGMPEPNVTAWEGAIRTAFTTGVEQTLETSNRGPRGMRYYHSLITPERDEKGEVVSVVTATRDITDLKELQLALDLEKQNLYTTLESIGDGVISTDRNGHITLINKVAERLTGWTRSEACGRPFEEVFHIVDEHTGERCENPIEQVLIHRKTVELGNNTILISKQGVHIPIEDTAAPIIDAEGNITGVVVVFRDFTDKREKQKRIIYLSYHDQLTGLYNRRFFEEEKKRLDTPRNIPITLVMADVNGLKMTNDAFGHSVGDELLRKAAEVIRKECRADDIIARIGGDEFCILLPKTSREEAEGIIKRIKKAAAREKVGNAILSISFGCETKQQADENIEAIFKKAEDNMYRAKLSESSTMRYQTVLMIIEALYAKHPREKQHSYNVSRLSEKIGGALDLSPDTLQELRTGGLMHDIGKITIDESILAKPEPLTDAERLEVLRHAETGYRILCSVSGFANIAEHVLAHHERWDGQGYPKGLKGEEIPLEARIIAVAEAYDAMTTETPYRRALSKEEAIREIWQNAGIQFDPEIARVFITKVLEIEDEVADSNPSETDSEF